MLARVLDLRQNTYIYFPLQDIIVIIMKNTWRRVWLSGSFQCKYQPFSLAGSLGAPCVDSEVLSPLSDLPSASLSPSATGTR